MRGRSFRSTIREGAVDKLQSEREALNASSFIPLFVSLYGSILLSSLTYMATQRRISVDSAVRVPRSMRQVDIRLILCTSV